MKKLSLERLNKLPKATYLEITEVHFEIKLFDFEALTLFETHFIKWMSKLEAEGIPKENEKSTRICTRLQSTQGLERVSPSFKISGLTFN